MFNFIVCFCYRYFFAYARDRENEGNYNKEREQQDQLLNLYASRRMLLSITITLQEKIVNTFTGLMLRAGAI